MNNLDFIKQNIQYEISFVPVSLGVYQIVAPFLHADGDLLEIYLKTLKDEDHYVELTDLGMTLMHLSYSTDLDKESTMSFIRSLIREQRFTFENGVISYAAPLEGLENQINYYAQGLSKIMSATALSRDVRESIFYEQFRVFVFNKLKEYNPQKDYIPLQNHTEYAVDYLCQKSSDQRPIYLFPIKNSYKAKDVLSTILFFRSKSVSFRSVAVYEDLDAITEKDRRRIINITDKNFYTIEDFHTEANEYFDRELG